MPESLTTGPDYTISHHGSICLLTPLSGALAAHLGDILGDECQWLGGSLAIEPRYLDDFCAMLAEDGYTNE